VNARHLLNKMAAEEDRFLHRTFVSPVLKGVRVRVRVEGVAWDFAVTDPDFEGWAVLQPLDHGRARVVGPAKLSQVREYLQLFPAVALILSERRKETWWGIAAEDTGRRLRLEGPAPILLAEDGQLFDTVRTRWDGARFYHEGRSPRRDPTVAAYLRESLSKMRKPEELEKRTLSPARSARLTSGNTFSSKRTCGTQRRSGSGRQWRTRAVTSGRSSTAGTTTR
jgi:hypothetical protein